MNTTTKKTIEWVIALIVPIFILLIPNNEVFTTLLAKFFCVTLIGIFILLFELAEPAIVGIYFIFAYSLTGIVELSSALATFSSGIVLQIICCLLIVEIVSNTSLLDRLAYNLIMKTGGSYAGIFMGLALIGIVFGVLIPSASASMIVLFLGMGICKGLDIKPYSNMAAGIIAMAGFAVVCAQHYLYSATGVGVPLALLENVIENFSVNYLQIFSNNIVMIPEIFIVAFVLTKLFKPEQSISSKEYFRKKLDDLGSWKDEEKKSIVVLVCMFMFFVTNKWHGLDLTYGFVGACILFYLPFINVGRKENLKGVSIDIILVVGGCMLIGTAGAAAGIKEFITVIVAPLLQGGNTVVFVAVAWLSGVIANMLMTPLALMTTLTIPLAQIGQTIGIDPVVVAYILSHTADYVLFPYESTSFLIMYGLGMMSMKQFVKAAGTLTLIGGILTVGLSSVYWLFLGIM